MKNQGPQTFASRRLLQIWWLFTLITLIYYFILLFSKTGEPPRPSVSQIQVVVTIGILLGVLSFIVPEIVLWQRVKKHIGHWDERAYVRKFYSFVLLRGLFVSSFCFIGLILALRMGINSYYPFWLIGLLNMTLVYPHEDKILSKIQRYQKKV